MICLICRTRGGFQIAGMYLLESCEKRHRLKGHQRLIDVLGVKSVGSVLHLFVFVVVLLTLLELQSCFRDTPLKFQGNCPQLPPK